MSATDELRRLLDERGTEHTDLGGMTEWTNGCGRVCRAYTRPEPLTVDVAMLAVPPEQAIAATLGGGECEMEWVSDWMGWHCKACDSLRQGLPDQKPNYCPNCGAKVVDE